MDEENKTPKQEDKQVSDAGKKVTDAGSSAVNAGKSVADAGKKAVDAAKKAPETAKRLANAARKTTAAVIKVATLLLKLFTSPVFWVTVILIVVIVGIVELVDEFTGRNLIQSWQNQFPQSTYGDNANEQSLGSSKSMAEAAKKIHDYIRTNGYTYSRDGLAQTDEQLTQVKKLCCATYVYWAVKEAGYNVASAPIHSADALADALKAIGFTEINNNEKQNGDILWYPRLHIEICAGTNGEVYNARRRYFNQNCFSSRSTVL